MNTTETPEELRARVTEYNAAREPGDSIMTDSGVIIGPGDVDAIISEPDYEKSLELSAQIFGGTKEDYRTCGMTQEAWEAIGTVPADPETQQRFLDSGFAARVDEFLADPDAGVKVARPDRAAEATESHDPAADGEPRTPEQRLLEAIFGASVFDAPTGCCAPIEPDEDAKRILAKAEAALDAAVTSATDNRNAEALVSAADGYVQLLVARA